MNAEDTRAKSLERARAKRDRTRRAIRRRRDQLDTLRAQVTILTEETKSPIERTVGDAPDPELALGVPSYSLAARMHRRHNTRGVNDREGLREPILQLYSKLTAQRFAAQHGVRVPQVIGRWPDPDTVEWESLPDRFVLKSNVGGGGVNVFPLVRNADGTYQDMLTGATTTRDEVVSKLWVKHQSRSQYFAEEFLTARGGGPESIPSDIKVFCFYGEPVYLEVRTGDWSRAKDVTSQARTFLADGTELFNVRALIDTGDQLREPADLDEVITVSAKLSKAIRRPLERLDFFETDDGLVFGEVTQNPGHLPALVPEWDRRLGEAYEEAYARLLTDLVAEGALHVEYGDADGPQDADGRQATASH
ncbi:teichuronopeptide biosynthesis TupA-like protein [Isoptericola sp. CG 20/1183]|uniref:Teichuronopeptide biosynthesis TupA-like protein n=1 Tax=Isoptericola halotolerans TaxID=300560 RepID=A0ABX5EEE0_9MICO|nr:MULTISPECIES: ATP-grasp fold amidoligase family protein [Isoptericola]PRZ04936.1 teichuronopeptide biosynthesis TupA-like protein [Isoptericola halotolerans]PRZ05427.1 teichuronopeptide biosynthesis TupA-like protein [Isoptericola sp. CG 20/1183]